MTGTWQDAELMKLLKTMIDKAINRKQNLLNENKEALLKLLFIRKNLLVKSGFLLRYWKVVGRQQNLQ